MNLGDYNAALADFSRVIEKDSDYGYAYFLRAQVHKRLGNEQEMKADYSKALELAPKLKDEKFE